MSEYKYLLTVVIPAYNISKYIEKCVASIASQVDDEVEIVLVDDGSVDGTEYICDTLSNKYTMVKAYHQENNGPSSARNIGIKNAKGKYIYFTDGDDYWLDNKYIELKKHLEKDCDMVYVTDFIVEDYKGRRKINSWEGDFVKIPNGNDIFKYLDMNLKKIFILSEIIFSNNVYFREGIDLAEDADFCFQIARYINSVEVYKDANYVYRTGRSGSLWTEQKYEKRLTRLKLVLEWKRQYEETGDKRDLEGLQIFTDGYFNEYMHQLACDTPKQRQYVIDIVRNKHLEDYLVNEIHWIDDIKKWGYEGAIFRAHNKIVNKLKMRRVIKKTANMILKPIGRDVYDIMRWCSWR